MIACESGSKYMAPTSSNCEGTRTAMLASERYDDDFLEVGDVGEEHSGNTLLVAFHTQ